ncbi:MAG: hypothetical protein IT258_11820 [Saprospiraceae bacterium]|nr:hypothetical protein [Saprospiraceae bacterium]
MAGLFLRMVLPNPSSAADLPNWGSAVRSLQKNSGSLQTWRRDCGAN